MRNYYRAPIASAQQAGPALTGSTVQTSILNSAAIPTLQASDIDGAGKIYKLTAAGQISTVVTTPGTLTFSWMFGAIVIASAVVNLNVVAKTNVPWILEWWVSARSIGAGTLSTMIYQGRFESEAVVGSPVPTVGSAGVAMLANGAPVIGTGFNNMIPFTVDLQATWSLSNANSIQTMWSLLESIN